MFLRVHYQVTNSFIKWIVRYLICRLVAGGDRIPIGAPGTIWVPIWQAGSYTYSCVRFFVVIIQHFVTTPLPTLSPSPKPHAHSCPRTIHYSNYYNHYIILFWLNKNVVYLRGRSNFSDSNDGWCGTCNKTTRWFVVSGCLDVRSSRRRLPDVQRLRQSSIEMRR